MGRDLEKRAAYMSAYRNTDEYREKARLRMEKRRATPEYQNWLAQSQDYRTEKKAEYRRAQGCVAREDISAQAAEKKAIAAAKKEARQQFKAEFVGPPKPAHGSAPAYRSRYQGDLEFSAKERQRAKDNKAALPDYYVKQQLGFKDAPAVLVEVKRIQLQIKRELRSQS